MSVKSILETNSSNSGAQSSFESSTDSVSLVSKTFSSHTFTVFSFTPESGKRMDGSTFYFKSFSEKLEILVAVIEKAARICRERISDPAHKNIFVGPEELFSNPTSWYPKEYYSKTEKNIFKKTIQKLSEKTDMILAPGTFFWVSRGENGIKKYRNNLYLFYKGEVKHYNKHNPYISDFGFQYDCRFGQKDYNFAFCQKVRRVFQSKKEEPSIIELGGLKIGVEICYDNDVGALDKYLEQNPKQNIDVHLLVSYGTPFNKAIPANQEKGFVFIHVDKDLAYSRHHYKARLALEGDYKSKKINTCEIIRQHYIYNGLDSKQEFFLPEKTSTIVSPKRVIPDSPATMSLSEIKEEIEQVLIDPPQENRAPRLHRIFNHLANLGELELLLETIKKLFSLDAKYIIEEDLEDRYALEEIDIRTEFSHDYISLLLKEHKIDAAIKAAQELLILKYDLPFLTFLFNKFQIRQQFLAGITVAITLPKEHQNNEVLRPFYEECINYWIDPTKQYRDPPITKEDRDLIIANFSSILRKYGNDELASEWDVRC